MPPIVGGPAPPAVGAAENNPVMVKFKEAVADTSPMDGYFGWDDTQIHVPVYLTGPTAWDDVQLFLQTALGWHTPAGDQLIRHAPLRHPKFPNLRCTRVGFKGLGFDPTNPKDVDRQKKYATARYKRPLLDLTFQAIPVRNLEWVRRADRGDESKRYTLFFMEPLTEELQLQQGSMVFMEGDPGPAGPIGLEFAQPPTVALPKGTFRLKWLQVPASYIMDAEGRPVNFVGAQNDPPFPDGLPPAVSKIDHTTGVPRRGALGRVNAEVFLGCQEGTLLFRSAALTPRQAPIVVNFNGNLTDSLFFDVDMLFEHFDPEIGPQAAAGPRHYGHNCKVWPGDFRAYYCASKVGARPTYFYWDFRNIFLRATAKELWP